MALSDFTPDTEEVVIKNGVTFAVRGLSFNDISKIIRVHYHDLEGLFDMYEAAAGKGGDITALAAGRFATTIISDAPGIVAHIIALAADEEAQLEKVQMLPLLSQYDALVKIGRLTFSDVEEVKKIFAQVMGQVGRLMAEDQQRQTQEASGK